MILPRRPIGNQVVVVPTFRIAGLAWNVGGHRAIPVAQVDDLAVGRSAGLPQVRTAGGVHRTAVARPRNRPAVEPGDVQRMPEVDLMDLAPGFQASYAGLGSLPRLLDRLR